MNFNRDKIPDFFTKEIIAGFQKLIFLNLNNPPARDIIQETVLVWVEVLYFKLNLKETELNKQNLKKAFLEIGSSFEKFPTPAQFLEVFSEIEFKTQRNLEFSQLNNRKTDKKESEEYWQKREEINNKYISVLKKIC